MRRRFRISMLVTWALVCVGVSLALSAPVPKTLPDPDGKPGDATKPVKVYILAGQSNMVGFGYLAGSRPHFSSIFLSADSAVIPGAVQVGRDRRGLLAHGVTGAKAAVYSGAFDKAADYKSMKPAREAAVALGTVSATLPSIDGPHTVVVTATIDVPATGTYTVHPGYGDSTHAVASVNGKEVYRKEVGGAPAIEKVELEAGKQHAITITYMQGGSAALWLEQVDLPGKGDLTTLTQKEGKFPWMINDEGKWTVCKDVTYAEARIAADGRWGDLTATSNGRFIGPEVPFGYVMGTFHDEQVLIIETSMGNRALSFDFRPPSSGKTEEEKANKWCGLEYDLMVKGVHTILGKIDQVVPNYAGQGYDVAGFGWFQGHKDAGKTKEEYERHLVNLIQDLRKEFKSPDMKAVVATVAFHGWNLPEKWQAVHAAQMAVGDRKQHPKFAGDVASVDARGYWRSPVDSPTGTDYHYNHNAETYMLVGDALGRAMADLQGGDVDLLSVPTPPAPEVANEPKAEPTEEELAASKLATAPMVVDGMMASYVERSKAALLAAVKGETPKRRNQFLRDSVYGLNQYYRAVGGTEYLWHDFGPDMKDGAWDYISFDPPEKKDKSKGARYRKVTVPAGSENWMAADFDARAAGWKTGNAPFAQKGGKKVALRGCPTDSHCRCGVEPGTLWEKEVILLRKTVDVPPLKEGHRYRLVVGGSNHVNGGDGFAIYADGQLLAESASGVHKRQGGQPRGAHIYAEHLPEFQDGKVTIAVKSFLRYNHPRINPYPPSGHISVWIEEQKLPPIAE